MKLMEVYDMEVLKSLSCDSESIPAPVAYVLGISNHLPSPAEWEALLEDKKHRPFYLLNPYAIPADAMRKATTSGIEAPDYVISWLSQIHQDLTNENLKGSARATVVHNKLYELREVVLRVNGYEGHNSLPSVLEYLVNTYRECIVKQLLERLAGTRE